MGAGFEAHSDSDGRWTMDDGRRMTDAGCRMSDVSAFINKLNFNTYKYIDILRLALYPRSTPKDTGLVSIIDVQFLLYKSMMLCTPATHFCCHVPTFATKNIFIFSSLRAWLKC